MAPTTAKTSTPIASGSTSPTASSENAWRHERQEPSPPRGGPRSQRRVPSAADCAGGRPGRRYIGGFTGRLRQGTDCQDPRDGVRKQPGCKFGAPHLVVSRQQLGARCVLLRQLARSLRSTSLLQRLQAPVIGSPSLLSPLSPGRPHMSILTAPSRLSDEPQRVTVGAPALHLQTTILPQPVWSWRGTESNTFYGLAGQQIPPSPTIPAHPSPMAPRGGRLLLSPPTLEEWCRPPLPDDVWLHPAIAQVPSGHILHIYVGGCRGTSVLAQKIGGSVFKVGTTLDATPETRMAYFGSCRYGAGTDLPAAGARNSQALTIGRRRRSLWTICLPERAQSQSLSRRLA